MSNLTEELIEELDAFDPKWKEKYLSIGSASRAAGAEVLYLRWTHTNDGKKYLATVTGLPDHVGESRKETEAMRAPESLPHGYDKLGTLPGYAWGEWKHYNLRPNS